MHESSDLNLTSARRWRHLERAAWIALALHCLAGLALLILLRDGLDTNPNPDPLARFAYVQEHGVAWVVGWISWHAASLSIVVFFVMLFRAMDTFRDSMRGQFALALIGIAAAMDLAGQSLLIGFAPSAFSISTVEAWLAMQRTAVVLSGYAANGLYSIATLLAVCVIWNRASRVVGIFGLLVFFSGILLSVTAAVGSAEGMYRANLILVPAILAWLAGVGLTARREAISARQGVA